jgi:hypothetical protein
MSTLIVGNGYQTSLPGLGRNRGFQNLSQKRVSKAVRENLRKHYGLLNVEVGCTPELASDGWHGSCKLYEEKFHYKITE